MFQGAFDWIRANPALFSLVLYVLSGVFTAAFKPRTPEEYAKMPKWIAASLKVASAIGLDPVKLVEALVTILKVQGDGSPKQDVTNVINIADRRPAEEPKGDQNP